MLIQAAPKILILESQVIIAADVSLQFSKLGYDVIGINTCADDALKTIENNRPDIVLMNIGIQGKPTGLRTAKILLEVYQIPVVFLSSNTGKELFSEVVDTQPYAFITKPFEKKDLQRGIETALDRMTAEGLWVQKNHVPASVNGLFIQQKGQLIKLEVDDILMVEANRNYCRLATLERKYELAVPLGTIENRLPADQFVRVHRSFLVNIHKINTLQEHGKYLTMQNYQIPISRRLRREVLKRIKGT